MKASDWIALVISAVGLGIAIWALIMVFQRTSKDSSTID